MSSHNDSTPQESPTTNSSLNQNSEPFSEEAPLLALINRPPHEMTKEELETEIANLRSIRVNSHILSSAIQKETVGKLAKKGGKKAPAPTEDLIADLL